MEIRGTFNTQIWMLSDKQEKVEAGKLKVTIVSGDQIIGLSSWNFEEPESSVNQKGPAFSHFIPVLKQGIFKLIQEVEGTTNLNSEYSPLPAMRISGKRLAYWQDDGLNTIGWQQA
jgi:hypothetical protein